MESIKEDYNSLGVSNNDYNTKPLSNNFYNQKSNLKNSNFTNSIDITVYKYLEREGEKKNNYQTKRTLSCRNIKFGCVSHK